MADLHTSADAVSFERPRPVIGPGRGTPQCATRAASAGEDPSVGEVGDLDRPYGCSQAAGARISELENALQTKDLLLQEVDHRVKNSLMMVSAMLRLEARAVDSPVLSGKLETMLERVDAVATIHRRLSQSDDLRWFDACALAEDLARDVIAVSGRTDIRLITTTSPVMIEASKASALGIVVNEVVTNAIKHAYADGRSGALSIIGRSDGRRGHIEIWDDGPGLGRSGRGRPDGLGNLLIERLSRQVQAEVSWSAAGPGTGVTLSFATAV